MAPDARTQSGTRFLSDIHRRCALEFAQECAEFVWQGQPSAAHAATVRALKEFVTNMLTVSSTREAEFQNFRWFCLGRKGP